MTWSERCLVDLIELHDHRRVPLSGVEREKRQGDYPYYGAQNIIDYIDAFIFDGEYVLVAEDGENLRSRKQPIAQIATGKFWVNNHAHILTAKEGVSNNVFLTALINWIDVSPYVTGAAQPKLSQNSLKSIKIYVPDYQTQLGIATVIGAYDQLIETNRQRIALLEESARLLYREWFVNLKFPGHESVTSINGLPEGWKIRLIGEMSSFLNRGITPKYDDTANGLVINQKCIRNGKLNLSLARGQSKEVKPERLVRLGDVLINSTGAGTLGRVAQVRTEIVNCTVDTHITIVRPSDSEVCGYLGMVILELEPLLSTMGKGATNQLELGRVDISSLSVIDPPESIKKGFHDCVWPIFDQIETLASMNNQLTVARDQLLPKLMSGEIQV